MEIISYSSKAKNLSLLKTQRYLEKNFILLGVNKIPFDDYRIMIEVNTLNDYLDDTSIDFYKTKKLKIPSELIYNKKNKFNLTLQIDNNNFSLKAFKPFWGKIGKNNLWLAFFSKLPDKS
jgi:predicted metal-dependent hydrolase